MTRTRAPSSRTIARTRRGMTLLEVLLAVVLLALIATVITTAVNSIISQETQSRKTVAAFELGNRLMLMHLDSFLDKQAVMPSQAEPIDYNGDLYFWDKSVQRARMVINRQQQTNTSGLQGLARFQLAIINVYESVQVPGSAMPARGEKLATLSRLYDPATARNADTMAKMDGNSIMEMINQAIGGDASKLAPSLNPAGR